MLTCGSIQKAGHMPWPALSLIRASSLMTGSCGEGAMENLPAERMRPEVYLPKGLPAGSACACRTRLPPCTRTLAGRPVYHCSSLLPQPAEGGGWGTGEGCG